MKISTIDPGGSSSSRLRVAAGLAIVTHLLAGLAMVAVLQGGLQTNPDLVSRFRYLTDHEALWVGSWLTWHLAALSILWFYLCFNQALEDRRAAVSAPGRLAVFLCAGGMALDLSAQALELGVMPSLAREALSSPNPQDAVTAQQFLALDRVAVMLTGYGANGLYVLATALLVATSRRFYPPWVVRSGTAVVLAGTGLSCAALANSTAAMFWANAVLVPAILVWISGVAISPRRDVGHA